MCVYICLHINVLNFIYLFITYAHIEINAYRPIICTLNRTLYYKEHVIKIIQSCYQKCKFLHSLSTH